MNNVIALLSLILIVVLIAIIAIPASKREPPEKRAGRRGEEYATSVIERILHEDDTLLTNVRISYDGREAEIDDVIINSRGVFIIEVKNYSGTLYGSADDYEWLKVKESSGGNLYEKMVRNPIKQMKRQVYLLAKYLQENGIDVWVDGYVYFVEGNSPIKCDTVLETYNDIDGALHHFTNNHLNRNTVQTIIDVLE